MHDDCNISSWGGGPPVFDATTSKWVLFVSEMADNCGLSVWQHMSTIVKTTSAVGPEGPYVRDSLVVPAESHNAYYVQDPRSKMHLIYHVGTGDNGTGAPWPWVRNCTNGTTPAAGPEISSAGHGGESPPPPPAMIRSESHNQRVHIDGAPEIHASPSLNGPWERVHVDGEPYGVWPRGASNPAPFIFRNGSVLALFRVYNNSAYPASHRPRATSRIFAMRAPSYKGPYTVTGETFHPPGYPAFNASAVTHVMEEDPCIWRDARGNFHSLTHFTHGHGFSGDGTTWHWSSTAAWKTTLKLSNGSVVPIRDSERPRVWVNPKSGLPELIAGFEVLYEEQDFRRYQSGQPTVFSGAYIINVP